MKRVLLTDNIAIEALEVFERYPDIEAVRTGTPTPQELMEQIDQYHAVIVRSPTKLTAEVIERAQRLEFIGRAGVGVDNIDVEAATRRGVVVMNAPRANSVSTAEHTIALMLAVCRRIPHAHRAVVAGEWERKAYRGSELMGKTLGVIGLGRVGREVARRMRAFEMEILAADPLVAPQDAAEVGAVLVPLAELLARSDWITVHVPLVDETRGLLGESQFAAMKEGVVVINCARGGVVDEDALVAALEAGKVAACALDVYAQEPPGEHALLRHPRSVFTPHLGAQTHEAQVRVATDVAASVAEALSGGEIRDAVNRP